MTRHALALALLIGGLTSCSDEEGAMTTLQSAGFTDIELKGHSWGHCEADDTCTGFVAMGASGLLTHGAVGCSRGCGNECKVYITAQGKDLWR